MRHSMPRKAQISRQHDGVEGAGCEEKLLPSGVADNFVNPLWPVDGWSRVSPEAALGVGKIPALHTESEDGGQIDEFRTV